MLNVYLSGEIHTNWREEIIQLCEKEKLKILKANINKYFIFFDLKVALLI